MLTLLTPLSGWPRLERRIKNVLLFICEQRETEGDRGRGRERESATVLHVQICNTWTCCVVTHMAWDGFRVAHPHDDRFYAWEVWWKCSIVVVSLNLIEITRLFSFHPSAGAILFYSSIHRAFSHVHQLTVEIATCLVCGGWRGSVSSSPRVVQWQIRFFIIRIIYKYNVCEGQVKSPVKWFVFQHA